MVLLKLCERTKDIAYYIQARLCFSFFVPCNSLFLTFYTPLFIWLIVSGSIGNLDTPLQR